MNQSRILGAGVLSVLLLAAPLSRAQCTLRFVTPVDSKIETGLVTVSLGESDDPQHPSAWQGPIKAGTCNFDDGIIEEPIAVGPAHRLFVTSYSGSERTVTLYDLHACSIVWRSEVFAGKVALTTAELLMGEQTVKLDHQCVPIVRRHD